MNIDKSKFIATFLAEAEDHIIKLNNGVVKLEKDPSNVELINELNREAHTLKGAARMMGFTEIQNIAHGIEDMFAEISVGGLSFTSDLANRVFKDLDVIKSIINSKIKGGGGESEKKKEEIAESIKEIKPQEGKIQENIINKQSDASKPVSVQKTKGDDIVSEEYIKVPVSRLNMLMNLVGEMVIGKIKATYRVNSAKKLDKMIKQHRKTISSASEQVKTSLMHNVGLEAEKIKEEIESLTEDIASEALQLDPIISELQDIVRHMRMLPASTIFDTYPRLVRDIAVAQSKDVALEIKGVETEIDKKILEEINPALIHILRNCVDHGIEKKGTIVISAFHEGGYVVIEVGDNGLGIDLEKVRATALRKKIVTQDEIEKFSENDVMNLIFMPGFSTSSIITDVSGRGVGLDVVKAQVQKLRGQVTIDSKKGAGTKISLKLPLTIAIMPVLIIKSENEVFAFPMISVDETIKIKQEVIHTIEGKPAIDFRTHIVPLVKLSDILGLPLREEEEEKEVKDKEINIIIASSLNKKIGFIVDDIIGQEEIYIKSLGEHLGKIKNVQGATILGTGDVIVVLDVPDLMENSKTIRSETSVIREEVKKEIKNRILVVEDSLTTRELERNILEAQGYKVDTAVDGLDAINKISQNLPNLVVTDIQMPRMDGFELCKTLKGKEDYRHIPVIIITALEKEEDKRRGIEVGADAYITKSSFDQRSLLETIERLIG